MLICISHVAKSDPTDPRSRIVELGAMNGSTVLWRSSLAEIIARIRAGVRYFVIVNGSPAPIEVVPGTLLADANLKTAADKCEHAVLRTLPALPAVRSYREVASRGVLQFGHSVFLVAKSTLRKPWLLGVRVFRLARSLWFKSMHCIASGAQ